MLSNFSFEMGVASVVETEQVLVMLLNFNSWNCKKRFFTREDTNICFGGIHCRLRKTVRLAVVMLFFKRMSMVTISGRPPREVLTLIRPVVVGGVNHHITHTPPQQKYFFLFLLTIQVKDVIYGLCNCLKQTRSSSSGFQDANPHTTAILGPLGQGPHTPAAVGRTWNHRWVYWECPSACPAVINMCISVQYQHYIQM